MKTITLISIFILTISNCFSQSGYQWPIQKLDTAREVTYLTNEEKDVILEMNKVRYNPAMYAQFSMKWLEAYYSEKLLKIPGKTVYETEEGKAALLECIEYLKKAEPAPILYPSRGLTKSCDLLVYDQSSTGATGHKGSGNSSPVERMARFGSIMGSYAENIHYGDCEPNFIVISLLIDDGVRSRGHRENILNKEFNYTGVAIGYHKVYENMCVNTFATTYTDK